MSDTQAPSQAAALFQKAHGRIVLLQRVESQIAALQAQKRRIVAELADAQGEINDEFIRLMGQGDEMPSADYADVSPEPTTRRNGDRDLPSVSEEAFNGRVSLNDTVG
jgi:hypothetical protein